MARMVVLLSGPVASGKSNLARWLESEFSFIRIRTWELLSSLNPDVAKERASLQNLGEKLDRKTKGEWLVKEFDKLVLKHEEDAFFVVDAVRIQDQIDAIRKGYGPIVKHIHLEAPQDTLAGRYKLRKRKSLTEFDDYREVLKNKTEQSVPQLAQTADIVVDTHRNTEADMHVRSACHLGLYGRGERRVVDVLVGGQYGSEGKGQVAAYLAPEYELLVRVGGPNAGHSVYEKPEPDVFHLLPSGTNRAPGANIVIGAGAVLNIERLWEEIYRSKIGPDRLTVDPQAMVILDEDIQKELGNVKEMGSTGQGVGAASARRILDRGVKSVCLARDLPRLEPYIGSGYKAIAAACSKNRKVLLEGTQGTGLSLYHGDYPHVTSRDTTVSGCLAEAGISPNRVRKTIMVCRTYPIRVQNPKGTGKSSGPMSQELSIREISRRSGINENQLKKTETTSTTKRRRRLAEFDWTLLRKSADLNCPTDVALTFVDYITDENRKARRFEQLSKDTLGFVQEIERVSGAPVSLIATRFHHRSIIDRRTW